MNKKLNSIFFILGATAFNVLVALISLVILFFIFINFIHPVIPESESVYQWTFLQLFVASCAISFFVYRAVIKIVLKKINIDKYFDPLIMSRYRK